MDVHHELHAFTAMEPVPHGRPRSNLALPPPRHGHDSWRPSPLERDALPRLAPRIPERSGYPEPARTFPRLAQSPRRRLGSVAPRLVEAQRRRRDHHAEAPEAALASAQVAQVAIWQIESSEATGSLRKLAFAVILLVCGFATELLNYRFAK